MDSSIHIYNSRAVHLIYLANFQQIQLIPSSTRDQKQQQHNVCESNWKRQWISIKILNLHHNSYPFISPVTVWQRLRVWLDSDDITVCLVSAGQVRPGMVINFLHIRCTNSIIIVVTNMQNKIKTGTSGQDIRQPFQPTNTWLIIVLYNWYFDLPIRKQSNSIYVGIPGGWEIREKESGRDRRRANL